MEKMSEKEFDIAWEPSVTSDDPEERKLARRLRIQRRLEALKRHEGSEDLGIIEKSQTEKQIETSAENLEKLIDEGNEIVTNVKIANEARAVDRHSQDVAIRNDLLKKLENEAEESLMKYRAISEKWSSILESNDPLDIHNDLKSQSAKCEEILRQKDFIIDELKRELKNADETFVADQKKQSEDINLLIERIENQSNTIANGYRKELVLIEEALNSERSELLENVKKKWNSLYKKRQEEEFSGVEMRKDIMKEYETEMRRVMIDHQEKYRSQKIELEKECENLEREIQRMKAICMMNVEKLDYNYAVLKCREDENIIIKTQQKRRINKLQDVINGLKKNYNELEDSTRLEIEKLIDQVTKAHKNIADLRTKSEHFARINEKQYFDIWDMNAKKANELVDKILTADRILHEQILGLEWKPPEVPLLKKDDLPSYSKAINEIQQKKAAIDESMKMLEIREKPTNLKDLNLERRLLNHILLRISDHTGFLIEDRLRELLVPYTYHDNIIIRLDNVFQALGIKSEDQIDVLLNFFLPYSYCMICSNKKENISSVNEFENEKSSNEENSTSNICSEAEEIQKDHDNEKNEDTENTKESFEKLQKIKTVTSKNLSNDLDSLRENGRRVTCKNGHLLEIDPSNVTKALREFAEKYRSNEPQMNLSINEKLSSTKVTSLSRCLTDEDIADFWQRYRDVFPIEKEKLWDGLLIGLQKYHDVLKERHRLNKDTESLRKQNAELRRLLETYVIKPANASLIPIGSRVSNKTA